MMVIGKQKFIAHIRFTDLITRDKREMAPTEMFLINNLSDWNIVFFDVTVHFWLIPSCLQRVFRVQSDDGNRSLSTLLPHENVESHRKNDCLQQREWIFWQRRHIEFRNEKHSNAQWKNLHSFWIFFSVSIVCIYHLCDGFFVSTVIHFHCLRFSIKSILFFASAHLDRNRNKKKVFCSFADERQRVLMKIEINAGRDKKCRIR